MTEHITIFGMKCAYCHKDCSRDWTVINGTLLHTDCIIDWNLKKMNLWRGRNDRTETMSFLWE